MTQELINGGLGILAGVVIVVLIQYVAYRFF